MYICMIMKGKALVTTAHAHLLVMGLKSQCHSKIVDEGGHIKHLLQPFIARFAMQSDIVIIDVCLYVSHYYYN